MPEERIKRLSKRYKVSREVVVRRLLTHEMVTQNFYMAKRDQYDRELRDDRLNARGFAPPHIKAVTSAGWAYSSLVLRGYEQRHLTGGDVSDYLGVRLKHLPRIKAVLSTSGEPLDVE